MSKKRKKPGLPALVDAPPDTVRLLSDVRGIIDAGRTHVAQAVNAGMVLLYGSVGDRIRREILGERRARYGEQVVETLAGPDRGVRPRFGRRSLFRMGYWGM